jgi:protein-L-isoaspartate(D-aspartate) O-methyltransferase
MSSFRTLLSLLALVVAGAPSCNLRCAPSRAPAESSGEVGLASFEERVEERRRMVEEQIRGRGVRDPEVLLAMERVPRHAFVPAEIQDLAYADGPLPIDEGQTISQPFIVALMTDLAALGPEDRVLEVGTGSGYQAAVLAEICAEVYTIEIVEPLGEEAAERLAALGYRDVRCRIGDGYAGWPEAAPFDAILVTAAAPRIPEPLLEQLRVGGRLVAPVGGGALQDLLVARKTPDGIETARVETVRFVPMTGEIRRDKR